MKLNEIGIREAAVITRVGGEGALRQHFLDMGLIPGAEVSIIKYAPLGDPVEILLHGYELTLRLEDAAKIEVTALKEPAARTAKEKQNQKIEHPGLGEEGGKFHPEGSIKALPKGTKLSFALVGNQNSGKTTLFNRLTGANQHVGNFPGVTVERKDGSIQGYKGTTITDLPGIYSMSPYSTEEVVSRDFVINGKPDAIINIVDATNIERNLYLTMQLLELDIPMVVALNMMDEVTANGGSVDVNAMESLLGVPVVAISAAKNEGVAELIDHALHVASYNEKPFRQDFCDVNDAGGAVHRSLHAVAHLIEDHAKSIGLPVRFAASKVIEGDSLIVSKLKLDQNEMEMMEHIILQMEAERGLDRSAAMADMRYAFIKKVSKEAVIKPKESREQRHSEKIDCFLTGKYSAIPAFVFIMGIIFWLTFGVVGAWLQELLEGAIDSISGYADALMTAVHVNQVIHGLIIDGIFTGVGSVLSFLPIIVTLFFFLSILEDSGYMARVAFFMDKLLRQIGLSGRSIVPMLIGFGCTVPAVMSTRTLPSERDRKMTILLTPFMSCTAKVPIYAFFIAAFFPENGWLIMTGLYFLGIAIAIIVAFLLKGTFFRGEAAPFVLELPNYRMPTAKNVFQLLWEKARDFLSRAFSVILIATIVVWFLKSFDSHFNLVEDSENSILALISGIFVPVMQPIGLGDWRICTSLISGFMAKESVVATMTTLFGDNVSSVLNTVSAATLLVFSLLYTPCVAAVASIRRELGRKWACGVVIWQCVIAWIAALFVRGLFILFNL